MSDNLDDADARDRLAEIAAILGVSVDCFYGATPLPAELAQAHEALRLWDELPSTKVRERVLEFMRSVAENPDG